METTAKFACDKVRHDQDNDTHLVLTLKAPKKDWQQQRPPVCVIPVIDVSGSMAGDKLHFAKQSVLKLIDQLRPTDYCSLVTFHSDVRLVSPPVAMDFARKDELKAKVGALSANGSTNFSGGLIVGLEQANAADLPPNVLTRVIMFTDGQANVGVASKREDLLPLLAKNAGRATVSAFGYGSDADHDLLADFAKGGRGNYAFIQNPDDAMSAFAKELGGLLSTYAQSIEAVLEVQNGHEVLEVLSDADVEEKDGKVRILIPDILSEEARDVVLSVRLKQQPQALPREMTVFNVRVSYGVVLEDGSMKRESASLKAKVRFVKPGDEQKDPHKELAEAVARAQFVKVQIEAEAKAKVGDFAAAAGVLRGFSADMATKGHLHLASLGEKVQHRMRSKTAYAASEGYRTSMRQGTSRGLGASKMDEGACLDLQEANYSLSNSAQDEMVDAFSGGCHVTPGTVPPAVPEPPPLVVLTGPPAPAPSRKAGLSKSRSQRW